MLTREPRGILMPSRKGSMSVKEKKDLFNSEKHQNISVP